MKKKVKEQYSIADEFRYNDDTTKSYIQNRLIGQIKWYDSKRAKGIQEVISYFYYNYCHYTYCNITT